MKNNGSVIVDTCTQRLDALQKHIASKRELTINGERFKLADVIALYEHCLETRASAKAKRADFRRALAERDAEEAKRTAFDRGLRAWVENEFGANSQEMADFGFAPPKVAQRSVETKHAAVLKMRATRSARHTMGSRQRQDVVVVPANDVPTVVPSGSPGSNGTTEPNGSSRTNGSAVHG